MFCTNHPIRRLIALTLSCTPPLSAAISVWVSTFPFSCNLGAPFSRQKNIVLPINDNDPHVEIPLDQWNESSCVGRDSITLRAARAREGAGVIRNGN